MYLRNCYVHFLYNAQEMSKKMISRHDVKRKIRFVVKSVIKLKRKLKEKVESLATLIILVLIIKKLRKYSP